jgi:tripartite-type tricarboxylate transporter receptor subunit TctC
MKRLITFIMAIAMAASLAACGTTSNGSDASSAGEAASAKSTASSESQAAEEVTKYPVNTLNIIVPYSAGGDTDIYARLVAERLKEKFGITVVVNNMTGGNGTIAAHYVMEADPDAATVLFTHTASLVQMVNGVADFSYIDDFACAGSVIGDATNVLAVMADSKYETLQDVIAAAQANPGGIPFSPYTNPIVYIFEEGLNIDVNEMSVGSSSPDRVVALMNGTIDMLICNYVNVADYYESGTMRILGVCADERNPYFDDIPTFKEQGYDVADTRYYTMRYPKGVDQSVIDMVSAALKEMAEDEEFTEELGTFYAIPLYRSPEECNEQDAKTVQYYGTLNGGNLG